MVLPGNRRVSSKEWGLVRTTVHYLRGERLLCGKAYSQLVLRGTGSFAHLGAMCKQCLRVKL